MKTLRLVLAFAVVLTLLSSCKKSDPTSTDILTSHKWSLTTSARTYSDSGSVSHNLIQTFATCVSSGYTEFHNYTSSNPVRLAYSYQTSTCPGYETPSIDVTAWDIDKSNANIYLNASVSSTTNQLTGGKWYTITTLNGSTMVLTFVHQEAIGYTNTPPYSPIYHTETDTQTWTAK